MPKTPSKTKAQAEFGKKMLAWFEVLHMTDNAKAVRMFLTLTAIEGDAVELAELAREAGAGAFANDVIATLYPNGACQVQGCGAKLRAGYEQSNGICGPCSRATAKKSASPVTRRVS